MKGSAGPITKGGILAEGVNILGAGADTTSIAILACLGDLAANPDVVPKLRKEIDDACNKLCLDRGNNISYTEAARLPYLAAFIKESMRLHPSIQYQLPRLVPNRDFNWGNVSSPKAYTLASVHVP